MIITQNICDACGCIVEHEDAAAVTDQCAERGSVERCIYDLNSDQIRADVCSDCNEKIVIEINRAANEIRRMMVKS